MEERKLFIDFKHELDEIMSSTELTPMVKAFKLGSLDEQAHILCYDEYVIISEHIHNCLRSLFREVHT